MKTVLRLVSFAGLILMLVGVIAFWRNMLSEAHYHVAALVGTALWFVTVPLWMKRRFHHAE